MPQPNELYRNSITGKTFKVTKVDSVTVTYALASDETKKFILPLWNFEDSVRLGRLVQV